MKKNAIIKFAPILRTHSVTSKENRRAIYENGANGRSQSERKMEKVISLLAPRAGSADGRLVPRPAKKRKEAA